LKKNSFFSDLVALLEDVFGEFFKLCSSVRMLFFAVTQFSQPTHLPCQFHRWRRQLNERIASEAYTSSVRYVMARQSGAWSLPKIVNVTGSMSVVLFVVCFQVPLMKLVEVRALSEKTNPSLCLSLPLSCRLPFSDRLTDRLTD
jgi:hypothetical protein